MVEKKTKQAQNRGAVTKPAYHAREAALLVLLQVERDGAYANLALKKLLDNSRVSAVDARLAAQLVYGTVRQKNALDHILAQLLSRPLEQLMLEARVILRMSIYQLYYLNNAQPYAVVDQAVRLSKQYANASLAKLVNAVLRSYLRRDEKEGGHQAWLPDRRDMRRYLSISLSYPRWLVDYLIEAVGLREAEQFLQMGNQHAGLWLRCNTLVCSRAQLIDSLAAEGIVTEPGGFAPESLLVRSGAAKLARSQAFAAGAFTMQGAASQLVAHALKPAAGSVVYDLCAAPGGKTTHLAALLENSGKIYAFDLHEHKVALIRANAQRLHCTNITAQVANSCVLDASYRGQADYLLLDAPCSGLGVLNERADSRWHKQRSDIRQLAAASYALLQAAAAYVKPGGLICYSTCTVAQEENTANVQRFVQEYTDFSLAPMEGLLPYLQEEADKQSARQGMLQLWPQRHHCEGFFIALLRKNR